jgi:hypothetical protein
VEFVEGIFCTFFLWNPFQERDSACGRFFSPCGREREGKEGKGKREREKGKKKEKRHLPLPFLS